MYKTLNWAGCVILGGLDLFFNPPNLLIGRFDFTSGCSVCIFRRFFRVGLGGLFSLGGLEIFLNTPNYSHPGDHGFGRGYGKIWVLRQG